MGDIVKDLKQKVSDLVTMDPRQGIPLKMAEFGEKVLQTGDRIGRKLFGTPTPARQRKIRKGDINLPPMKRSVTGRR